MFRVAARTFFSAHDMRQPDAERINTMNMCLDRDTDQRAWLRLAAIMKRICTGFTETEGVKEGYRQAQNEKK
ncbi:hypothetical protein GCM10007968_20180 [Sporolactobacillus putidus]|uniref:Uncharacterized protein n=1 Tax=Sporolactobacillus putidus TaxID=492735 RepID=A0A917S630_9BACL|nr:hypothetical protein GCM10007968_20180 [Sporolactobacillus putidus]